MAFQPKYFDNEVYFNYKIGVGGAIEHGLAGTIGTTRQYQMLGTEANITLEFIPKGTGTLRVPTSYETLVTDGRDIVNKAYVDSKIAGKNIFTTISAIGAPQNGQAIIWDNTNSRWTMGAVGGGGSSYTFQSGVQDIGGNVVKWGNTALDRNTDIFGNFALRLGYTGQPLSVFSVLSNTTVSVAAGTGQFSLGLGGFTTLMQGGSPSSSIGISSIGIIVVADNSVTSRGIRGSADHSGNVQDFDFIQKIYTDNRIATRPVAAIVKAPTITQNGYAIVWDNSALVYTLAPVGVGGGGTSTVKEQQFIADGIASTFTVSNGTITLLSFVDANGNVQRQNVNYTRSGQVIDFGTPPPINTKIVVHYFEDLSIGGGGGGTGGGHIIYDGVNVLAQRDNLVFRNALTASDSSPNTVVEFGGTFTKNTTLTGGGFNFTGSGFGNYQFSGTSVSLGTAIGSALVISNDVIHTLRLGETAGVIFNVGSDVNGDLYQRIGGKFSRIAIGTANQVLKSNGTIAQWGDSTSTTVKDQSFVGNGSQTAYLVTTGTVSNINYISIGGAIQTPSGYTLIGNTVTFNVAPLTGLPIYINFFESVGIGGGGGGPSYTFVNGLTTAGTVISLGGPLNTNTVIDGVTGTYNFTVSDTFRSSLFAINRVDFGAGDAIDQNVGYSYGLFSGGPTGGTTGATGWSLLCTSPDQAWISSISATTFNGLSTLNLISTGGTASEINIDSHGFISLELALELRINGSGGAAGDFPMSQGTGLPPIWTNRINPRTQTIASSATPTFNANTNDRLTITALAVNTVLAAPSGTPVDGQGMEVRIKDNGNVWTIGYNAIFRHTFTITPPAATTIGKTLYLFYEYNSADNTWDLLNWLLQA